MLAARLTARAGYAAGRAARKAAAAAALVLLLAMPATAETLRLVALGDSLTSGYGLRADQSFTAQLQRWLDERGADVEVVNMGVAGDTTTGALARLDWALAEGADAVLVELGGNDLLRGTPPALTRANLDAILTALGERDIPVLLAGLEIPLNFGLQWQVEFESMFAELAREHDALVYPSFLEGVWTRPELMQPDMLHPNAEGVARIVDGIGPLVLDLLERAEA
jgi:acyl-CoA thioesterase-1